MVHGGAGGLPSPTERRAHVAAMRAALAAGCQALAESAAAAVVAAVAYMEAHTELNAGRGATLDVDGNATLDAGFMEGRECRFGAVGCVTRTPTPVVLARALCVDGDFGRLIVGAAADALVERFDAPRCEPHELVTPRALRLWRERRARLAAAASRDADTVGAVALDAEGRLAAGVSTGGLSLKPAGRVGDSAVVGAGFWAEAPLGACVTTGIGEAMLREGTARRCVRLVGGGVEPGLAAKRALAELSDERVRPAGGLIFVGGDGRVACAHTSPGMAAGYARLGAGERPVVRTRW